MAPLNWYFFTLSIYLVSCMSNVLAQYYNDGGNYQMSNGYGGDGHEGRPKLQLGLRVKIPAMKFDLPRMSLPKITISAKIRQPNRPRTINLPEINLDTSSKVASPGGQHQGQSDNGAYGYNNNNNNNNNYGNNYNNDYGQTKTFTISSSGEDEQPQYGNNHNKYQQSNQYQAPSNGGYTPNMNNMNSNNNNYNNNNNMGYSSSNYQPFRVEPSSNNNYNTPLNNNNYDNNHQNHFVSYNPHQPQQQHFYQDDSFKRASSQNINFNLRPYQYQQVFPSRHQQQLVEEITRRAMKATSTTVTPAPAPKQETTTLERQEDEAENELPNDGTENNYDDTSNNDEERKR